MAENAPSQIEAVAFADFSLHPSRRQLLREGKPVPIGSRAFDLLCALVGRPGQIVTSAELMSIVWQGVFVEEANLRVNLTNLRKALGEGDDRRFIVNVPGRGYMFAGELTPLNDALPARQASLVKASGQQRTEQKVSLPRRLSRIIGRDETISALACRLESRRFLTVVGPGGIGKTTVALSVAERLLEGSQTQAAFIDLAPVTDPKQVPSTVAAALGLPIRAHDETENILEFLKGRTPLLIFDSCEHLAEAVASLTESIYLGKNGVRILATSREPLRVIGENIHRLDPLSVPPQEEELGSFDLLSYSAVELFVERMGNGEELTVDALRSVGEICRRLDGVALAIELAAGRASTFGVKGLASRLDDRFRLLTLGRRTALPRQQTLRATIDWSYTLLAQHEQKIFRRCGVFPDQFSLEGLEGVVGEGDRHQVGEALEALTDKSLVTVKFAEDSVRYRLLDSMRAYAADRLSEAGEAEECSRRHAAYVASVLAARADRSAALPHDASAVTVADLRIALQWIFSEQGDRKGAVALAADAGAFFLDRSLLPECADWSERALGVIADEDRGSRTEVDLLGNFAMPILFTRGGNDRVRDSLRKAIWLSKKIGDSAKWSRLLNGLYVSHLREADFRGMRTVAEAASSEPSVGQSSAATDWMTGLCQYFSGEHEAATETLTKALEVLPVKRRVGETGVDPRVNAFNALARSQWFRGFSDQALATSRRNLEESASLGHPVSHCIALTWMAPIALWTGDLELARERIDELVETANRGALAPSKLAGSAWQGVLSTLNGEPEAGAALIRASIQGMLAINNRLLHIIFQGHLAEATAACGKVEEALATLEVALQLSDRYGETVNVPSLLRQKGDLILEARPDQLEAAEKVYLESLHLAKRHGALATELRTALSLTKVHEARGTPDVGIKLLASVYERFTEGFDTSDLVSARQKLTAAGRWAELDVS